MEEQRVQPVRQAQDELSGELYADYGPVDKRITFLEKDRNRVRYIEEKQQSNTMVKSFDENHDDDMLLSDLKEVLPGEEFLTADDEIIIQDVLNDLEKDDFIFDGKTLPESDEDKLSALNFTLTPAPLLPWPTFFDKKDEVSSSVPTEKVSDDKDDASKTPGIMGVPPLPISNLSAETDFSTVNPSVPEKPLDASLHSQINVSTATNITVKSDRSIGDPALNGTAKECVTYQVIDEGTIRNRAMLVSSDGFSYTVKPPQKNGKTNWRCSNRRKGLMCYASVTQTDDVFSRGVTQHIHSADPNIEKIVRMKRELKRDAARDDHVPAGQLVKVKLGEVYNNENLNLPRAATLIRTVNRARQKLRPKENLS